MSNDEATVREVQQRLVGQLEIEVLRHARDMGWLGIDLHHAHPFRVGVDG